MALNQGNYYDRLQKRRKHEQKIYDDILSYCEPMEEIIDRDEFIDELCSYGYTDSDNRLVYKMSDVYRQATRKELTFTDFIYLQNAVVSRERYWMLQTISCKYIRKVDGKSKYDLILYPAGCYLMVSSLPHTELSSAVLDFFAQFWDLEMMKRATVKIIESNTPN